MCMRRVQQGCKGEPDSLQRGLESRRQSQKNLKERLVQATGLASTEIARDLLLPGFPSPGDLCHSQNPVFRLVSVYRYKRKSTYEWEALGCHGQVLKG